jgi:two-component system NtrC family sensor kinase
MELLRFLLVASIVGPTLILFGVGWVTYKTAFADAENEIIRTSEVAREHASKVFDSFRLVSDRVQELLDGLDDAAIAASEPALHDKFTRLIRNLPQIQSFIVLGGDGRPQVATARFPVDRSQDFSDRDYFNVLKDPAVATYFSRVQVSRFTGETFFGWGEARRGPLGEFDGVIDIAISPEFFRQFYETLVSEFSKGADGRVVTMIRADGQLLVRYPAFPGNPGIVPGTNPFFAAIHANPERGVYTNRSVVDAGAPERLYAFHKVPGHPIYIVAARTISAIWSGWLREMLGYFAVTLVGTIILFWATMSTFRGARREHRALTQLNAEMARRLAAEDQLRQAQKMEAVGQLTGGIAHDFNNLLTVIRSSIDLLRRPGLPEERRERYLEAISQTTTRATKLTKQLLAFARRQTLKPEVFDVVENLGRVLEMVRSLTGSRISIETRAPDSPIYVNVDASQLDASIVNMAVNARDAMKGEGRLIVSVRAVEAIPALRGQPAAPGDYIAVAMTDTGEGIPAEQLDRIFEPFFTTKTVGQGTGLGLSQVLGFAKQSGGEVAVESEVGRGATFTLYLPRVARPRETRKPPRRSEAIAKSLDACVLVVEDNSDVGAFVGESLRELGCVSVLTTDASQALAELAKDADRFDVVFSDVVMSGMSGLELAELIRVRYSKLPVVLTSGYSHVLAQGTSVGLELLQKPYSIEELAGVLRRATQGRRL